jgi:hypothetical protein
MVEWTTSSLEYFARSLVPMLFCQRNPLANRFSPTFGLWTVQGTTWIMHHFLGITYRNSIVKAIGAL